jgi:ATP-dependent DNA helicase RecG
MLVQFISGVGPVRAGQLARLGVERVADLLYLFPRRYLDATMVAPLGSLQGPAKEVTVSGTVVSARPMYARRRKIGFEVVLADSTGRISCRFFGRPYLAGTIQKGECWIMFGDLKLFRNILYLDPLEYEPLLDKDKQELSESGIIGSGGGIIPIYPLTEGLSQKVMRRITGRALGAAANLEDRLPESLRQAHNLLDRKQALLAVHRPQDLAQAGLGRKSLVFEELFYLELMLLGRKFHLQAEIRKRIYRKYNNLIRSLGRALPFSLTEAQKQVLRTIDSDLTGNHPMNRLIQGDVGSGKTIVAVFAALRAVENGYQAAIMAPTEVLAEQHHRSIKKLLAPLAIKPVCLLGKMNAGMKKTANEKIASGEAQIIIGTHALIQEKVSFADLGLVIIDEQHRFGVNQRLILKQKGEHSDCLVMTATPIPRSLALTIYGDLDVSVIDELPAGRKKIATHIVLHEKRAAMQRFIAEKIRSGEQAYVVCPRIDEDENGEQAAAEEWYVRYRDKIFPQFKVVMLHGRMPSEEKEAAMQAFEAGEAQVLVGTTVIEVGIDVPAATVMVIEGAERFGLSQLHQLRGRVGRSDKQSFCLLVPSAGVASEGLERLRILTETADGFKISEQDLRLRGPGDFFGERQSGLPELKVADLIEDYPVLVEARSAAEGILKSDPYLEHPEHGKMRNELILRYRDRVRFLRAG